MGSAVDTHNTTRSHTTINMNKHLLLGVLLVLVHVAQPFFFETKIKQENSTELDEVLTEEEDKGWWFGFFSRKKNETNEDKSENQPTLPLLSDKWVEKYKKMVGKLSELKGLLKDSGLPRDIFEKYNSSINQLMDLKNTFEDNLEKEVMEKYNFTVDSYNQGKQIYSEALDKLNDMKALVGHSVSNQFDDITDTLGELKDSWERFSFYKLWQEKYKKLAKINLSWNNSLVINDWFNTNETNNDFLENLKSSLPKVESYKDLLMKYLPSLEKSEPVCTSKELTCPDSKQKFTTDTCCSPLWLSIGAPLGLGNECWIDLNDMASKCNLFSCYGLQNGTFNSSDGCTYIPDMLLNFESCVIHDLCYVTPGVTKEACDLVMQENINRIYCDNVNRYERRVCSVRASLAATALEWTDRYFVAAGVERDNCHRSDSLLTRIWKFSVGRMFRPIF